jgi:hypothetical protein
MGKDTCELGLGYNLGGGGISTSEDFQALGA